MLRYVCWAGAGDVELAWEEATRQSAVAEMAWEEATERGWRVWWGMVRYGGVGDVEIAWEKAMGGNEVGGYREVKFLHIERKIPSVVHSHPPSHYIRKHAPG